MSNRPKYLHNRRIIIERDFNRARGQRYFYCWDNPMGTNSHGSYAATFLGALVSALVLKVSAEFDHWQRSRPAKTWRLP